MVAHQRSADRRELGPRGPAFAHPADSPAQATAVNCLVTAVGLEAAAWATQVHGPIVCYVNRPGWSGAADALWTDVPGLGVVGRSADCPLLLLGGRRTDGSRVWGFAHASWRSTLQHITLQLVTALTGAGVQPATLQAVICPSVGPCCYEVGPEIRDQALAALGPPAANFFTPHADRFLLDLWAANISQLTAGGVAPDRIDCQGVCTICSQPPWPSYRREGHAAGRFAAIIGNPAPNDLQLPQDSSK